VIEVTERPMFGGLAFLVRGHMTVLASSRGGMMIRADPATSTKLTEQHRHAAMRGRSMAGWLHLDTADLRDDDVLARVGLPVVIQRRCSVDQRSDVSSPGPDLVGDFANRVRFGKVANHHSMVGAISGEERVKETVDLWSGPGPRARC
jgi:hypothetical protein